MGSDLEVFEDSARVTVAVWKNVLVTVWRADVEPADVRHTEKAQATLLATGSRFASLAIIERGALRMSAGARQEAARIARLGDAQCAAIALVIAVEGFGGAAVRAGVTAVHLLSGAKVPQRSFADIASGTRWLMGQLHREAADATLLVAAVRGLRP